MPTYPNRELKVEENLHYVKFDSTNYVLANKGFTNWTQALNSSTDDGIQYIGESGKISQLTGYAPSVSYEARSYPADAFAKWVYEVGKGQKLNQTFEEVEVETWNETEVGTGEYHAYHRTYEVQPDNPGSGEAGGKLTMSGTFSQVGAQTEGTFNIQTKTFKPASEE